MVRYHTYVEILETSYGKTGKILNGPETIDLKKNSGSDFI